MGPNSLMVVYVGPLGLQGFIGFMFMGLGFRVFDRIGAAEPKK